MLGHTSHLPPASHRLSVLATQRALITSDTAEQEKRGRGREGKVQRKGVFLALCVLGEERLCLLCCPSWLPSYLTLFMWPHPQPFHYFFKGLISLLSCRKLVSPKLWLLRKWKGKFINSLLSYLTQKKSDKITLWPSFLLYTPLHSSSCPWSNIYKTHRQT